MIVTCHGVARPALLALAAVVLSRPGTAQLPSIKANDLAKIVDGVLRAVVTPDSAASRVPISKRGVYFDHVRTRAAFGLGTGQADTALPLRVNARPGSRALLDDCDQLGLKPCRLLGWGVYVWIQPLAVTSSSARVRAWVEWPDRGRAAYLDGVAPTGRATLVGFGREVYLVRTPEGGWKVDRLGDAIVG